MRNFRRIHEVIGFFQEAVDKLDRMKLWMEKCLALNNNSHNFHKIYIFPEKVLIFDKFPVIMTVQLHLEFYQIWGEAFDGHRFLP